MKGDVGMSPHEKEGEQEDAYTKTKNSFITPPYIFVIILLANKVSIACMQFSYPQTTDSYTSERNTKM